jgi:hypothetical protein
MGGTCSTHVETRNGYVRSLVGNPKIEYFGDLGIDGRIILKQIERNIM